MSNKRVGLLCLTFSLAMLGACTPQVGSEAWCKAMNEKPKLDWSARELGDYTKHCLSRHK